MVTSGAWKAEHSGQAHGTVIRKNRVSLIIKRCKDRENDQARMQVAKKTHKTQHEHDPMLSLLRLIIV